MQSKAATVAQYLASLPKDRRKVVQAVRAVILKNLDDGYREGMQYGMIGYCVRPERFPGGYHADPSQPLPFAALGAQKNYLSLYLMAVYSCDAKWFKEAWARSGKKLDMGKSCVRFQSVDDLALDVIGDAIRRIPAKTYVERYLALRAAYAKEKAAKKAGKKSVSSSKSSRTRGSRKRT